MSWQEDLRKLDEELATGKLSADDYRIRRDRVLSSAVNQTHPETPADQNNSAEQTTILNPVAPTHTDAQSGGSTSNTGSVGNSDSTGNSTENNTSAAAAAPTSQPITSWREPENPNPIDASTVIIAPVTPPTPSASPSADTTQVVSSSDTSADRTQAVPSWQTQQTADTTQVVSGQSVNTSSPATGFAQPQIGHPWNAPATDATPPWGGNKFPPISYSNTEWIKQGPEVFTGHSSNGKTGRISLVFVVILVLAGLIVGGIFLFKDSGNQAGTGPSSTTGNSTPATAPTKVDPNAPLIDRIPKPPGSNDTNSGALDPAKLVSLGIMDQASADVLSSNQVSEIAWRGSVKNPDALNSFTDRFSITAAKFADQAAAQASLTALSAHLDQLNYINDKNAFGDVPPGLDFHKDISTARVAYYGMWVSGSVVIQVHVWQDPAQNENAMSGSYQRQVVATLVNFPLSK